jgi:hypothetical protein
LIVEEFVTREVHLRGGDELYDEIIYLSLRRSIKELFERFGERSRQDLRESTELKISNPLKVIQNVVEHYRLSEIQKENILMAFGAEPEHDKYGIAMAVTQAAEREETWEKSIELERIGGKLISLPLEQFKAFDE